MLVMDMEEDEVLQRITRLLEQGCTMLATHHDCGAPLFRCQGEVVCPVCSFGTQEATGEAREQPLNREAPTEAISNHDDASTQQKDAESFLEDEPPAEESAEESIARSEAHLRRSLQRKLLVLTAGLDEEQDLDKLKKQLDCIEGLLRVFRFLQR
jgi:UPF0148 protein